MNFDEVIGTHPNILVVGDLILDTYLWGNCNRISPEAPVQVIDVNSENILLGGAGNVLNNIKSLGGRPSIISVIGDCEVADDVKKLLDELEIKTDNLIIEKDRKTSRKTRLISSHQHVIRFDRESISDIDKKSENAIISSFKKSLSNFPVVVLSDYGKGVLTKKVCQEIIKISNKNNIKVLVDPKGYDFSKYYSAYTLTPNKKEVFDATGISIIDEQSLLDAHRRMKQDLDLQVSIITLSQDGISHFINKPITSPTLAREVFDVTGAGDTVIAALAFGLANNLTIDSSIAMANLAAGVVVEKIGTSTSTIDEIIELDHFSQQTTKNYGIKEIDEIQRIVTTQRRVGKKIVFTNGCFDILHIGHVKYLEKAKQLGDILIVGINSDKSVTRLKGKGRPINNENDRSKIINALGFVDLVIIFHEDTPLKIISKIKPDILVKGGDYIGKEVVGAEYSDRVELINFIHGKSTSNLISKIENL